MSAAITIKADKLLKQLNLLQRASFSEAAEQALKSFGFESREILSDAMKAEYKHATNYTLKSPRFKQNGLTLTIGINDDPRQNQSAAKYLQPTDRTGGIQRKPIQPTTLSGFIRGRFGTNKVAVPAPDSRAGRLFINAVGNVRGKKVKTLISQLASPSASYKEQYFVVTDRRGGLSPGIWRRYRAKNSVVLAFALLDQKPTQKTSIDIHGLLIKEAQQQLPVLIERKLRRLLS